MGELRRELSFGDSYVVANFNQQRYLLSLLLDDKRHGDRATLIYRGSKDGWGYADFHRCCDNKGATVTLFKTDKGRRFGGFSSVSWDKSKAFKQDTKSFLFSLDLELYFPIADPSKSIACSSNLGHAFGISGADLSAFDAPFNNPNNCHSEAHQSAFMVAADL